MRFGVDRGNAGGGRREDGSGRREAGIEEDVDVARSSVVLAVLHRWAPQPVRACYPTHLRLDHWPQTAPFELINNRKTAQYSWEAIIVMTHSEL